ncbi:hypothetical protein [Thermobifida cellulosilytica]|uniref:Uncharacterized protein n=1 Tax=Thermobifida cellulosilytica TB100 TaxID=665004 RepID=A0A147KHH7_THECS|nr:hypothetical protein [Thermobifida cellulosilytica]KUP96755.1 hypothetical protein AC529_10525 [Thermobifida cellulosilytica TB100]
MLRTGQPSAVQQVTARLRSEFQILPQRSVERCVADVWRRAEHLGFRATPRLVERVAREHLRAMVNSTPHPAGGGRPD